MHCHGFIQQEFNFSSFSSRVVTFLTCSQEGVLNSLSAALIGIKLFPACFTVDVDNKEKTHALIIKEPFWEEVESKKDVYLFTSYHIFHNVVRIIDN